MLEGRDLEHHEERHDNLICAITFSAEYLIVQNIVLFQALISFLCQQIVNVPIYGFIFPL